MSNTQVTLCPLEASIKLEKHMGNILVSRSDKFIYWHFLDRNTSHMGFIGSPWEAISVCYKVRDIDAKLTCVMHYSSRWALFFWRLRKRHAQKSSLIYLAKIISNLFWGGISYSSLPSNKQKITWMHLNVTWLKLLKADNVYVMVATNDCCSDTLSKHLRT